MYHTSAYMYAMFVYISLMLVRKIQGFTLTGYCTGYDRLDPTVTVKLKKKTQTQENV